MSSPFPRDLSGVNLPKITVATVVRNGAATLDVCMRSVAERLGDVAEHIVIDGASTDGTLDILRAYESTISRWISEPDRGIYDAMNKALDLARGDWLLFLGADDELLAPLPELARRLTVPDAVYYGDVKVMSSGRRSGGRFTRYRLMQENICHQALFYPRVAYSRHRYDTTVGILADHKYNIELWGTERRFVYVDEVISRFNDNGLSSADPSYFEPIKLQVIRSSFGPMFYGLKRMRSALVRRWKGRRVAA